MTTTMLLWPLRTATAATRAVLHAVRRAKAHRFRPSHLRGCLLWLRPEAGLSTTWSLVTRWTDRRRGLALHARALTDCPTFVRASDGLNERPALRFDAGGALLETPGTIRVSLDGELSIFVVLSLARSERVGRVGRLRDRLFRRRGARALSCASAATLFGVELDGHNELLTAVAQTESLESGMRLLAGRPYLIGLCVRRGLAFLLVNGVRVRSYQLPRALDGAFTARLRLGAERGATERFCGDVGDVLLYDHALDALESAALASALMRRYGIGQPRRLPWLTRFRRSLWRIRDTLARICWATPRPDD